MSTNTNTTSLFPNLSAPVSRTHAGHPVHLGAERSVTASQPTRQMQRCYETCGSWGNPCYTSCVNGTGYGGWGVLGLKMK